MWRSFVGVMLLAMAFLALMGPAYVDDHFHVPTILGLIPSALFGGAAFARLLWRWGAAIALTVGVMAGAIGAAVCMVLWLVIGFALGASP
jgi:hypothetical protein